MANEKPGLASVGIWTGIGFAVGLMLLFAAFFLTFTICADTRFAKLLFPFAIIADPGLINRWWLTLFVALLQYPFYFGLITLVRAWKDLCWCSALCA
jgi:hypothetical protein